MYRTSFLASFIHLFFYPPTKWTLDFPAEFSQHVKHGADRWNYHEPDLWIVLFRRGTGFGEGLMMPSHCRHDGREVKGEGGMTESFIFPGAAARSDWDCAARWWSDFPFHIRHVERPTAFNSSVQSQQWSQNPDWSGCCCTTLTWPITMFVFLF